ncbi:hypothetical protein C2G38_209589 [Gigaspora rosea]|uniref:Uncharacterized protein n=1 Tax=Gigaspora rosea TaxID=44941 RepID=A0A397URS7_9GLOM|nr:hypothetical protein C2G38_209589 [Gigaspora rosea]
MKEASKIDVKSRILEIVDKYNYANEYSIESYANVEGINTNVRSTLNDIKNLKGCKMNEIAKCICETVYYMDLKKDDPLLSGIIDLRCVPVQLKSHLIERELWDSVNKEIHLEEVPEDYTNYIRCIVTNDDDRIPDKFYDPIFKEELKMYRAIRALLYSFSSYRFRRSQVICNDDIILEYMEPSDYQSNY